MRILMLHCRYQTRGGEDESTDVECQILRDAGYRVDLVTADNSELRSDWSTFRAGTSAIWSRSWHHLAAQKFREQRYDIMHVQNFFPLISPSVYFAANRAGVPVVQALRNYRIACPSANLFRERRVCTDCVGRTVKWPGVLHRCYRASAAASAAVAAMTGVHHALGTWSQRVSVFVAVSKYVRNRLVEDGLPADRTVVKYNCLESEALPESLGEDERYVLFVGRVGPEKGCDELLRAWAMGPRSAKLRIIGEGELPQPLPVGVERLGRLPRVEVHRQMRGAICVVVPGRWPEPLGRISIEAFAAGTPVIAAAAGGIPEVVTNEHDGLLFEPGNLAQLSELLTRIIDSPGLAKRLGQQGRHTFLARFSPVANVRALEQIYEQAKRRE